MQKFCYKLTSVTFALFAGNLHAHYTGILMAKGHMGISSSGIMSKTDDSILKNCALTPLVGKYGLVNLMCCMGLDASFILIRDVVDWFGFGGIVSLGVSIAGNLPFLNTIPDLTTHAPSYMQLGLSAKIIDTFLSLGVRMNHRSATIKAGKQVRLVGADEWNGVGADSYAWGWFSQVTRFIPLEDEKWSIILSSELHGDFYPANLKFSSGANTVDYGNSQLGLRVGVGIAWCAFGEVYP